MHTGLSEVCRDSLGLSCSSRAPSTAAQVSFHSSFSAIAKEMVQIPLQIPLLTILILSSSVLKNIINWSRTSTLRNKTRLSINGIKSTMSLQKDNNLKIFLEAHETYKKIPDIHGLSFQGPMLLTCKQNNIDF